VDAHTIIDQIERAFAGVRRGSITLHEAEVIDAYGTDAERRRARARDTEEDWRDVPDASVEACPDALTFVDPESWRFYLPAYMRYGLRHLQSRRSSTIDHAIYSLAKGGDRSLAEYKLHRFRTLNLEQAQAVRSFLVFASENDAWCDGVVATEALGYWSRAAEGE
jgi:hypothetical protein